MNGLNLPLRVIIRSFIVQIESVAESYLQGFNPPNENVPKARKLVGRSSAEAIEQRQQRLYRRQLDGLSARHLVLEHSAREGIGIATAWKDWKQVNPWNEEDWQKDRENMLSRLQTMRVKLFNQALKKGQLQTAAQVLDSLGRVIGESVETVNINAPELAIRVEQKSTPS